MVTTPVKKSVKPVVKKVAGLSGKSTTGVGADIVSYLTEICLHFDITILVTSGYRDASTQAQAMWDNWIKLQRGATYSVKTLPTIKQKILNDHYVTFHENKIATASEIGKKIEYREATALEKQVAKTEFLRIVVETVGNKSKHSSGRAVDLSRVSVPQYAYRSIARRMTEVDEKRQDIYHFECDTPIPAVSEADIQAWGAAPLGTVAMSSPGLRYANLHGMACNCLG